MGCGRSRIYHDNEKGVDHKELVLTAFEMQNIDIVHDLDTDNDQKGRVAVDCIFRPTREIYGQRAQDMRGHPISWAKYGIVLRKRPHPYDFPAFAHEKPAAELSRLKLHSAEISSLIEGAESKWARTPSERTETVAQQKEDEQPIHKSVNLRMAKLDFEGNTEGVEDVAGQT